MEDQNHQNESNSPTEQHEQDKRDVFHIKDLSLAPPNGWRYVQPESGMSIRGGSLDELASRVVVHRRNNGYPQSEDTRAEMQDWICQQLDQKSRQEYCKGGGLPPNKIRLRFRDLENFFGVVGRAVKDAVQTKDVLVPQEEAERRATICAECPWNVHVYGCGICHRVAEEVASLVGGGSSDRNTTTYDDRLHACGICKCSNKAQVHFTLEVLRDADKDGLSFPDWCWKK